MKRRRALHACAACLVVLAGPVTASAQLDPLLFLKATKPNVLVALDLSSRMQRDTSGVYYDPVVFNRTGELFEAALGVNGSSAEHYYRRRYTNLAWSAGGADVRASVRAIEIVGDQDPQFAQFDGNTRLGRASAALTHAIGGSMQSARFGLVTTRQASPRIDEEAWASISTQSPSPGQPTDTGEDGRWRAGIPVVDSAGAAAPAAVPVVSADSATGNADLVRVLGRRPGTAGALLPAGFDTPTAVDAPLGLLLDDLRTEAARLVAADRSCRNTVAVLIAAGGDASLDDQALADKAGRFLDVGGRRVPIYVIALAPDAPGAAQLASVARRSGGQYFEISQSVVDRVPTARIVPELSRALNLAVQHAFAIFADFNVPPSASQPYGRPSVFATASPVIGTVNLENALDSGGARLPDTRVAGPHGETITQRSNVMLTAGFELPGFLGRLGAFRVYRPVLDPSQVTGYRFSSDGTRLWTAHTPAPDQRNIFTVLPGVGIVPLRSANAAALAPYLGVQDPASLLDAIRSLPLGALVNSVPALLEPPSMPFADPDYLAFAEANRNRRSIVFAGGDDGMMHAIDARTGIEVWAAVPFNLLPKLRLLPDGAPLDAYPYLVDGSPRLADVKVFGSWRTYLLFGQGPGGTFYQAFDVTLDNIAETLPPDTDLTAPLLAWFANPRSIPFRWSFPRYEVFDSTLRPYGDLAASATESEKTVGETWSTPSVGRAGQPTSPFVAIVGSGRLPRSRERQPQRGGQRAGTRLYMLDMATGGVVDSRDVGADGAAEEQDDCAAESCAQLKNALHADPLGLGPPDGGTVTRVYQGDLDGHLWRFDLAPGPGPPGFAGSPRLLLDGGADQPVFGSVALLAGSAGRTYLFLGTGSDLLPRAGVTAGYRFLGLAEASTGITRQFESVLRTAGSGGVDESLAGAPSVAGSVVFFTTSSSRPGSNCEAPEVSLYALTIAGGVAYDANGDHRRDERDSPVVSRLRIGRATGPVVADRHVFVATGDRVQVFGDPDAFNGGAGFLGVRIVSWREIRHE